MKKQYQKPLLKITGEAFGGPKAGRTYDPTLTDQIVAVLKDFSGPIVVGGGNIVRGSALKKGFPKFDNPIADHMGMQATLLNGLFLAESLADAGRKVSIMSALGASSSGVLAYSLADARKIIKKGDAVLILVGGTGNCGFTTDTAAVVRSYELGCDLCLKLTRVDGVFDSDPEENQDAQKFGYLTYQEFLSKDLDGILDRTAVELAKSRNIPIAVCNKSYLEVISDAKQGIFGTLISSGE